MSAQKHLSFEFQFDFAKGVVDAQLSNLMKAVLRQSIIFYLFFRGIWQQSFHSYSFKLLNFYERYFYFATVGQQFYLYVQYNYVNPCIAF